MSRDQRVLIDFIDEGNDEFFNYLGESTFLLSLFMDAILLRMTALILVHHILTIVDRGFIVVDRVQSTGWTEFMQKRLWHTRANPLDQPKQEEEDSWTKILMRLKLTIH